MYQPTESQIRRCMAETGFGFFQARNRLSCEMIVRDNERRRRRGALRRMDA